MSDYVSDALRASVAERANRRCEYCQLHEDDTLFAHEPDHIIARKHGGATSLENLAWSCAACNRAKGSDVASIDPATGNVERLYHPRNDDWEANFRVQPDGTLVGITPQGRATVALLHLNWREHQEIRQLLVQAGKYFSSK